MERIMIVTKNALAEKSLQEQLHLLNYEVLCHQNTTVNDLLLSDGPAFLLFFDCLIVSESLSQIEYQTVLADLARKDIQLVVLRKSETIPTSEDGSNLLPIDASFEKLREILVNKLGYACPDQTKNSSNMLSVQLNQIHWTTKEQLLFELLQENAGSCLSREDICMTMWGAYSNSNKAQLSNLVKQIKEKLEISGIGSDKLMTLWGQGYRLDKVLGRL